MRILIVGCEMHIALSFERMLERQGTDFRIVADEDGLGEAFSEFEPTHVMAGTDQCLDAAKRIASKRGSDAKIGRFR